jgi:chromatin segregation and condensation protein Rec8/ScpA/Scc1 (kleisin family)
MSFTEELKQVEQHRQRLGRKRKENTPQTKSANFKLTPDVKERLGHYSIRRTREENRKVTESEIVEEALSEFLKGKGF